jgi:CRP-like cAMP-binding protein
MRDYMSLLREFPLFEGVREAELGELPDRIPVKRRKIEKNGFVFMAGDQPVWVGFVLSGALHIIQDDFWGNRSIIARIGPGEIFGEAFVFAEIKKMPVSVMTAETSDILLMNGRRLLESCLMSRCSRLVKNMLRILARKNTGFLKKMEHITRRGVRQKLLSCLSSEARRTGSACFEIPFNRQQLADYLCVDRSAMSAELCRMRDEGLIRFHKNNFELLPR